MGTSYGIEYRDPTEVLVAKVLEAALQSDPKLQATNLLFALLSEADGAAPSEIVPMA